MAEGVCGAHAGSVVINFLRRKEPGRRTNRAENWPPEADETSPPPTAATRGLKKLRDACKGRAAAAVARRRRRRRSRDDDENLRRPFMINKSGGAQLGRL